MKPTLIFLSTLALVISVTTGFTVTSRTGSKQQYIASRSLHIIAKWNHNGQSRPAIILLRATTREEGSTTKATTATWTQKELDVFANKEGIDLSMTTLGPAFRAVARSTTNSSQILGYGEGFVRPAGEILHLDKMEVFKKMVDQVKTENDDFRGGGTTFGVGLLFGYQCLLHGKEKGCTEAEFLAIDDEDFQHRRLVRYYSRAGFKAIKYVGDDFQDIPARMVWGGCGTLMRAKIDDLLPFWTMLLKRS